MSGLVLRATELSHLLLALAVKEGDTVIDATAGQGRDTCFLAALVGETGQVWAFDIQDAAIYATQAALMQQGLVARVQVICDDHAHIGAYDIPPVAAAIFNLGWLPGGDHSVTSNGGNTVAALTAALNKLKAGGALVIVAYPGHAAGAAEYAAIKSWLPTLPVTEAQSMEIVFPAKALSPVVLLIEKQPVS